jgi:hypothetical protein
MVAFTQSFGFAKYHFQRLLSIVRTVRCARRDSTQNLKETPEPYP